jgi:DNA polymerase III, gamma/tau subunits
MQFADIIGQQRIKHRLLTIQDSGRAPHALLFTGKKGIGKLPLALAYAQRLCCQNPTPTDSCGVCPSCRKYNILQHPDLHLVFPFAKENDSSKEAPPCSTYLQKFY